MSDKVTEVGEKVIQLRIMKAEEPSVQAKYSHFQEEVVKMGTIDFEGDLSS